ncbi:MAG: 23S rRNA (adenine(2503)-C(2))-methyltransferase RlmN [Gammaproteobacteria bacterium]
MSDNLKINLLGYTKEEIESFFVNLGEKSFRANQLFTWIHQKGCLDFDLMTNFSELLREQLKDKAILKPPAVEEIVSSPDGTMKYLIKLESGSFVEMVRIPEAKRTTLCISTQAGCALQCSFCATGAQGLERSLSTDEIIGQLWLANFYNRSLPPITNIVFMGMGEPLQNTVNVTKSISVFLDQQAYGLSKRRVTLSTSGIVPEINKLANLTDVSLAISLHAPNNALRDELVPINKKYPLEELIPALQNYLKKKSSKSSITVEYVMIDGVNDSLEHARELAKLLSKLNCKINLIPFNPFEGNPHKRSQRAVIESFKDFLMSKKYITTIRTTRGDEVDGACGQLSGHLLNAIKGKHNKIKALEI